MAYEHQPHLWFSLQHHNILQVLHIKAFYSIITGEYQFLIEVTITENIECGSSVK